MKVVLDENLYCVNCGRRKILCLERLRHWFRKKFHSSVKIDKSNEVFSLPSAPRAKSTRPRQEQPISPLYVSSNGSQTTRSLAPPSTSRQCKYVVSHLNVV